VYPTDSNLIVGLETADDAGVYKVSDDSGEYPTLDFFYAIVDDHTVWANRRCQCHD
jgi:selenide,water dikinase